MNHKVLRPLTETKYLSMENAWRYRSIMRLFYINDQKYRHYLMKEDVHSSLLQDELFGDYTLEMCRQDLDALVEWGNLSATQDTTKVTTYQQFVNKQFRYQMTEYAIEIERLTIRLENLFIEGGSLEPTLLERIKDEIKLLKTKIHEDAKSLGGWWSSLNADFQRLNQNYQDYIRDWNSIKADELMKSKNFLLYKEKLVDYLRNFVKELQFFAHEIEVLLLKVSADEQRILIDQVSQYEADIPRIDMENVSFADIHENIQGKYESIRRFFVNQQGRESEVEKILEMTNEIIRKITRYAAGILEMSSQYSNRRDEYMKVLEFMGQCETLEEAHELSALVFGIDSYHHFQGDMVRQTESIFSSIWDEIPLEITTEPRIRNYRERMLKTAIRDDSEDKKKMQEAILKQRQEEQELVESCIKEERIEFEKLHRLKPFVRKTLLRWLGKAILENGALVSTENGQKYRLLNPNEKTTCTLICEDGDFVMPAFILSFENMGEQ